MSTSRLRGATSGSEPVSVTGNHARLRLNAGLLSLRASAAFVQEAVWKLWIGAAIAPLQMQRLTIANALKV